MTRATLGLALLAVVSCARSITLHADFEGGSLARVRKLGDAHFAAAVPGQADQQGRNRQASWYYFSVDGGKDREVTVTLDDLVGEYNFKPGAVAILKETLPLWSYDRVTWTHFDGVDYDAHAKALTLRFTPREARMFIAHVEPYTYSRLQALLDELRGRPSLEVASIGKSVEGRDLPLLTITNPAVPDVGKRSVWMMFRQHAWETGSSFAGEGALRFLASDDAEARALRDKVIFKVFPMLDPDGCAHGGVRFNRHGYDVNRNWDSVAIGNPEHQRLMPEIHAAKSAMLGWLDGGRAIDIFLTLHNEELGEYLSGGAAHAALGQRFWAMLKESSTFAPSRDLVLLADDTVPAPGRQSVPEFLYRAHKVPAFLIEQRIAKNPRLGHLPTSRDRLAFGRDLARVMAYVVLGN